MFHGTGREEAKRYLRDLEMFFQANVKTFNTPDENGDRMKVLCLIMNIRETPTTKAWKERVANRITDPNDKTEYKDLQKEFLKNFGEVESGPAALVKLTNFRWNNQQSALQHNNEFLNLMDQAGVTQQSGTTQPDQIWLV